MGFNFDKQLGKVATAVGGAVVGAAKVTCSPLLALRRRGGHRGRTTTPRPTTASARVGVTSYPILGTVKGAIMAKPASKMTTLMVVPRRPSSLLLADASILFAVQLAQSQLLSTLLREIDCLEDRLGVTIACAAPTLRRALWATSAVRVLVCCSPYGRVALDAAPELGVLAPAVDIAAASLLDLLRRRSARNSRPSEIIEIPNTEQELSLAASSPAEASAAAATLLTLSRAGPVIEGPPKLPAIRAIINNVAALQRMASDASTVSSGTSGGATPQSALGSVLSAGPFVGSRPGVVSKPSGPQTSRLGRQGSGLNPLAADFCPVPAPPSNEPSETFKVSSIEPDAEMQLPPAPANLSVGAPAFLPAAAAPPPPKSSRRRGRKSGMTLAELQASLRADRDVVQLSRESSRP